MIRLQGTAVGFESQVRVCLVPGWFPVLFTERIKIKNELI